MTHLIVSIFVFVLPSWSYMFYPFIYLTVNTFVLFLSKATFAYCLVQFWFEKRSRGGGGVDAIMVEEDVPGMQKISGSVFRQKTW